MPSITTYDGTTLQVTPLRRLADGVRVAVTNDRGQKWYLQVQADGSYEVEASWDADGDLSDVPEPDGLEESLAEYAMA